MPLLLIKELVLFQTFKFRSVEVAKINWAGLINRKKNAVFLFWSICERGTDRGVCKMCSKMMGATMMEAKFHPFVCALYMQGTLQMLKSQPPSWLFLTTLCRHLCTLLVLKSWAFLFSSSYLIVVGIKMAQMNIEGEQFISNYVRGILATLRYFSCSLYKICYFKITTWGNKLDTKNPAVFKARTKIILRLHSHYS